MTADQVTNYMKGNEIHVQMSRFNYFTAFSINKGQENRRPKLVSKSAILEMLIITGLKSDTILSVVDRNVAIFTTQHTVMHYEFQVSQGKL